MDYKRQRKSESESCSDLSNSLQPHGLYSPWNSPGENTGVGSLSLLQGIFPTQGSHPCLLHCGWILYQLNHKRDQRLNCQHLMDHRKSKRIPKKIYLCFIDYAKAFDYVDHTHTKKTCGKFSKKWKYQSYLLSEKHIRR